MTARDPTDESRQESAEQTTDYPLTPHVHHRDFDGVEGTYGTIRRPTAEGDPELSVEATHYADEPDQSAVEVELKIGDERMVATLRPAAARTFARDLGAAAKHADEGAEE